MRIPITDKFLWDMYELLEAAGDIAHFFSPKKTWRDIWPSDSIFRKYEKSVGKRDFGQLVYYLKRKDYIRVRNLKGKRTVMLTKKGMSKALRSSFNQKGRHKRKDGKWIMIAFDIPRRYRKSRNLLTSILHNLGYKMFQQSVWITSYDVFDKTETSLQIHSLDQYVKIFLIEKI